MRIDIEKQIDGTTVIVDGETGEPLDNVVGYKLERNSRSEPELLTVTVRLPTFQSEYDRLKEQSQCQK